MSRQCCGAVSYRSMYRKAQGVRRYGLEDLRMGVERFDILAFSGFHWRKGETGKGNAETALPDLRGRALAEDNKIQCFSLWR